MTPIDAVLAGARPGMAPPTLEQDALGWLISPLEAESFFSQYLEKTYVVTGEPDTSRFRDLLSLADLDAVIGGYGVKHPNIRLVRHEEDVPARDYVFGDSVIDPMRAARLFAEGATIIFGSLHDRHERVRQLCTAIGQSASMKTQANIYLTPPRSQGFDIHWDTHDVFVIQVEGTKDWRMYAGGPAHPLGGQKFDPARDKPGEQIDEFTLHAGQVLYIPRGIMHAAAATEQVSLHITLGLIPYTWIELLSDCLTELAERSPEWRENLPLGFARDAAGGVSAVERELRARAASLMDQVDVEAVLTGRVQAVEAAHRPRSSDYLRQAIAAGSLRDDDMIAKRVELPMRLNRREDRLVLRCGEREVSFPAAAQRTLEAILAGDSIRLSDLEDGLDPTSRRTVITTLIREGIVANRGTGNGNGKLEVTHGR